MTNFEYYKDEILRIINLDKKIGLQNGKPTHCGMIGCYKCDLEGITCGKGLINWLYEEYEPYVDWSKVEVDTPIYVSEDEENWDRRYFTKYEDGVVYAYPYGATSWSNDRDPIPWKYAKLKED